MKDTVLNIRSAASLVLAFTLVGCSSDDPIRPLPGSSEPAPVPPPVLVSYDVTITNLTTAQPMSPIALVAHEPNYQLFTIGESVSLGLEQVAEAGDNSLLLDEANEAGAFVVTSGEGLLTPSASETISFTITDVQSRRAEVSLATMLVNTNDAITAAKNIRLNGMAVGDTLSLTTLSYDTGTEANSEAAGTIPGPADGGEGFNAIRDDIADRITLHGGVITADDGMVMSVLNQHHRWDNPVVHISITRTE